MSDRDDGGDGIGDAGGGVGIVVDCNLTNKSWRQTASFKGKPIPKRGRLNGYSIYLMWAGNVFMCAD